ncbi:hypothetical protein ASPVEDRAFT_51511 [Aspergillus versicolor CBS 583.65]|uniref:Uncharacterized protein n=1 Tax=Aspergillus versicolor CBS 583.65 TaxID=1036611 RepID=A0A1L9PFH8_ASPVE|nr:uncharacterized protein ASPVEDRAFT_51511 [Aspergillus versicolor CBS 583.65]OJJ00291.1 hypothetical protein ASPVEDRAFT_51511 [Aspergillus versicolor CBS 583.65]
MEASPSRTRPGGLMLPSPVDSVESLASSSSGSPAVDDVGEPGRSGNVMITLSLTPDPPTSAPSRPPLPRSHMRSRSLADDPGIPAMIRAHSSPGLDSRGRYIFVNGRGAPTNMADSNTPKRYLPLQLSTADSFEPRMLHRKNISETISEHAELDTSASSTYSPDLNPSSSPVPSYSTPRMGRRRPSSPLHFPHSPSSQLPTSPSSTHSSPFLGSRYNEAFPSYSTSSVSSMPSTPTSLRSRSPSISSLETIPDIPDAEAAALESDRIAALKAAADRADDAEATSGLGRRRGVSDMSAPSSLANARTASGTYRKRWSVCGAERRQDLDLETIWED